VDGADVAAGLEAAKMKMIDTRFNSTPLIVGQLAAVFGSVAALSGTARAVVFALAVLDAALIGVVLTVRARTRRWWDANRIGTRYENW
jgi:hypothetical protein